MTTYAQIAAYYLSRALPLARAAATTDWPSGSDATPVTEALADSVQTTARHTDRLIGEEA